MPKVTPLTAAFVAEDLRTRTIGVIGIYNANLWVASCHQHHGLNVHYLHRGSDIFFLVHNSKRPTLPLPVREGTAASRYRVGFAKLLFNFSGPIPLPHRANAREALVAATEALASQSRLALRDWGWVSFLLNYYLLTIHNIHTLCGVLYTTTGEVVNLG